MVNITSPLQKSTILYINQNRQENFDILIGKGISEALSWRKFFKRVILICYSYGNNLLFKKIYSNCYLIGIPFDLSRSTYKSIFNIGKNYLNLYMILNHLTKITKIDIIRIENLLLSGPPIYKICKKKKIPYIMWLGGHERKALFIKYKKNLFTWFLARLIVLLEIIILKNSNFVFPVTDELYELAKKRNVKNMILSPNYVDIKKFRNFRTNIKSSDKIQLLYVGRFEEEKGIKVLLTAIKILLNSQNKFELSMVGDGTLRVWVEDFIKKNHITNVRLLGIYDHEKMPQIYNSADIFILPSHTEGSPASLIEAMSCGSASIASAVGECKKIIKNMENGILIPPGSPKKLSEAIKLLISNANLLEKFQKNSRTSIVSYTKNYVKIHKFIFERIVS